MWIVYSKTESFEVPTENEAAEYCKENEDYKYVWKKGRCEA